MIRYRTGDLTSFLPGACPCGRTGTRMSRIKGRNDDVIVMRGRKVFPSQIEEVLLDVLGKLPEYRLVLDRDKGADVVTVQVGLAPGEADEPLARFRARIESELGVTVAIVHVDPAGFAPFVIKARRVVDNRGV